MLYHMLLLSGHEYFYTPHSEIECFRNCARIQLAPEIKARLERTMNLNTNELYRLHE